MLFPAHAAVPEPVVVRAGRDALRADLVVPPDPGGVVVVAYDGPPSPHDGTVAEALVGRGFATLLVDLLTSAEEREAQPPGDVALYAARLGSTVSWLVRDPRLRGLPLGLFGVRIGAAAALIVSMRMHDIAAVVSRAGRPDLAAAALPHVRAPTLLIVGGADPEALDANHQALRSMSAPVHLHVIPGAGRLLAEPGALREVAVLTGEWFQRYLMPSRWMASHPAR